MALAQQSKWGSIIAGAGLLFIAVATLTPGAPPSPSPNGVVQVCRGWCDDFLIADFVRNIILFMPMAFGLRLAGISTRRTILFGTCLSACIELLQIRIIVGRDASVLDWISNTLGTVAGAAVGSYRRVLLRPEARTAVALTGAALVGWVAILTLGAWGIQPAPSSAPYWGQRVPHLREFPPFHGELLSERVNGVELPSAHMANDDTIRDPMKRGWLRVDAVVRPGSIPTTKAVSPIARVADGFRREILMLGRGGGELVFRYRLRATSLRLETPAFALPNAFPKSADADAEDPDAPLTLTAVLDHGRVTLASRGATTEQTREITLTPALAWSFFLPWDYWFGPNAGWLSELWLAALLMPAGYWAAGMRRDKRNRRIPFVLAGAVAAVIALMPIAFSLPPASTSQFVSSFAGALVGWTLAVVIRRRQKPNEPNDRAPITQ